MCRAGVPETLGLAVVERFPETKGEGEVLGEDVMTGALEGEKKEDGEGVMDLVQEVMEV